VYFLPVGGGPGNRLSAARGARIRVYSRHGHTIRPPFRVGLNGRGQQIAALIAAGHSNKDIAAELSISPTTAARHVANILAKLGFRSRTQIAAWVADQE